MNRLKAPHPPHLSPAATGEDGAGHSATGDAPITPQNWLSSALAVWVRTDSGESDKAAPNAVLPVHTAH